MATMYSDPGVAPREATYAGKPMNGRRARMMLPVTDQRGRQRGKRPMNGLMPNMREREKRHG